MNSPSGSGGAPRSTQNSGGHPSYQAATHSSGFRKEAGVACESCHGPAQRWLNEHYREGWRTRTPSEKHAVGMADTRSLRGRAESCVPCHVGAADMDVNHDLIAAGHPPLHFEFAAYHANLPRHWDDAKDTDSRLGGKRDFEARAWAIGQVVSARAALE